jgi:TatD DNase family protein
MPPKLYDAHNHLQDERLRPHVGEIMAATSRQGIARMVVNGSCEEDWPEVLTLGRKYSEVLPSFGYHPWYLKERTDQWRENLADCLDRIPSAIGEIGLDRWIKDHDVPMQEEVFLWQLGLAAERNLPASIHCLKAWGRLYELLRSNRRPDCGFLLHSYGGPREMIRPLADLGAYFSLPGFFAHERKERQRETFRNIPAERLLIETDAPDQLLPENRTEFPLHDAEGKEINHPANLGAVYRFAAELRQQPFEELAAQVEANFNALFGGVSSSPPSKPNSASKTA